MRRGLSCAGALHETPYRMVPGLMQTIPRTFERHVTLAGNILQREGDRDMSAWASI